MPRTPNRDISRPLKIMRDFLLGRKHTPELRNADDMSPKTLPPPCLPYGPHAKYARNYYYEHDARREVKRPRVLRPEHGKNIGLKRRCYQPECFGPAPPCSISRPLVSGGCDKIGGCTRDTCSNPCSTRHDCANKKVKKDPCAKK